MRNRAGNKVEDARLTREGGRRTGRNDGGPSTRPDERTDLHPAVMLALSDGGLDSCHSLSSDQMTRSGAGVPLLRNVRAWRQTLCALRADVDAIAHGLVLANLRRTLYYHARPVTGRMAHKTMLLHTGRKGEGVPRQSKRSNFLRAS